MIDHPRSEIAATHVEHPDALGIFIELRRIVSARKQALKQKRMGYPDGLQVFHRANYFPIAEGIVAIDYDASYLHLRPFIDGEDHVDAARRDLTDLRRDGCVL